MRRRLATKSESEISLSAPASRTCSGVPPAIALPRPFTYSCLVVAARSNARYSECVIAESGDPQLRRRPDPSASAVRFARL